jgi:hypothetical protein
MAALTAWYRSPEYQPLIAPRQTAATGIWITLKGWVAPMLARSIDVAVKV